MRFYKPHHISPNNTVGVAVAFFLAPPTLAPSLVDRRRLRTLDCLVASFRAQCFEDWRMIVTHDGPLHPAMAEEVRDTFRNDSRVTLVESPERKMAHGHHHRQAAAEELLRAGCRWLLHTNDDNYYCPAFLEWMIATGVSSRAQLVYCDMVHSHRLWQPLTCKLVRKHVDLGAVVIRDELARKVPFDNYSFAADWDWFKRLQESTTPQCIAKVPATLFTHN